jgi:Protein of unknown function (DUF2939)
MKKLISIFIALALVGLAAWFYLTPHLTLRSIKAAADLKDGPQLAKHVNFPVLRESLKMRLNGKLSERASMQGPSNALSGLSSALFSKMVDPLVDKMVTPENLVSIVKGSASLFPKESSASKPKSNEGETIPPAKGAEPKERESEQEVSMSYESFNRFNALIKKKNSNEAPLILMLQREGLVSWKLVDVNFQ